MPLIEQTMMTFAALSYAPVDEIDAFLATPPADSPVAGWDLAWGPVDTVVTEGNLVFVAASAATNQCAVVIRGTYPHFSLALFEDLFQDLTVGILVPWRYPPTGNAMIAGGTKDGLEDVVSLKDARSGQTILEFLRQGAAAQADVYVTGHSLGGCLTTVLSAWLRFQLGPGRTIFPYSFAAPTAGNQSFADMFTGMFPNAFRYYNVFDVIPMAWSRLTAVRDLYPQPGPGCPLALKLAIDALVIPLGPLGYQQPNGNGNPLQGAVSARGDFFAELLSQHDHNYYLKLVGAPPVPYLAPPAGR